MRLLLRHLKRSIFRAPKETLVLLLTLFLSAILFACVGELNYTVRAEWEAERAACYGNAQIEISSNLRGDSRYITKGELSDFSDDCAVMDGYFFLNTYTEQGMVFGGAADLTSIDEMFPFSLVEAEELPLSQRNFAVYVTEKFAKEQGLAVGDTIPLRFLGVEKTYRVYGINDKAFFGDYDFLVNADGAIGVLATVSPIFALFDGENLPYNTLFLRVKTGVDVAEFVDRLNVALADKGFTAGVVEGQNAFITVILNFVMTCVLLLSMVIACVLVWFSLNILREKRKEEMEYFRLCGMSEGKIFLAFCLEIFCYLTIGVLLGLPVAAFCLTCLPADMLQFVTLRLTWRGSLICILAQFFVGVASVLLYRLKGKRAPKQTKGVFVLSALASFVLLFILTLTLPVRIRYIFTLLSFVAFIAVLFMGIKPLAQWLSRKTYSFVDNKKTGGSAPLLYALKNVERIGGIHNLYRILCAVLSVSVVLVGCLSFCERRVEDSAEVFACDYVVAGANQITQEHLFDVAGTEACSEGFFTSARMPEDNVIFLISVDDATYYSKQLKQAPTGNGIVLAPATAKYYGLELGDEIVLRIADTAHIFYLQGYSEENSLLAYINAEDYGFVNNILLVRANEGQNYALRLSEKLAVYGCAVQTVERLTEENVVSMRMLSNMLGAYMVVLFALTALGCVNLVWVIYARRKEEFHALRRTGMTKGELVRMLVWEGGITLIVVLLLSALGGGSLSVLFDCALQSFGERLF